MTSRNSTSNTLKNRIATSRTLVSSTLFAVLLAAAGSAHAALPFSFTGVGSSPAIDFTLDGSNYINAYVGQYQLSLGGGNSGVTQFNTSTFCVDFSDEITAGNTAQANIIKFTDPTMGYSTASYLAGSTTAQKQTNADAIAYLVSSYLNSSTGVTTSAEVQMAIWDISNQNGNTSKIAIKGSTAAGTDSATFITSVDNFVAAAYSNATSTSNVDWVQNIPGIGGTHLQDFAILPSGTNFNGNPNGYTNTPEPGSVAMLMGLGATGVGILRRRRAMRAKK
jgi:hypothetical protein